MGLHSPDSAVLSAVIFNAIIIVLLIPLALRGVKFRPIGAAALLRYNLLVYGLGGVIAPFVGIKLIDLILVGSGSGELGGDVVRTTIIALRMLLVTAVLLGLLYPLPMTGAAQVLFPAKADGSLVKSGRQGRRLVPHRPGLHGPGLLPPAPLGRRRTGYDAMASGASNLGPTSQGLSGPGAGGRRRSRRRPTRPAARRRCRSTW